MVIIVSNCQGCGGDFTDDLWCEVCELLVPKITGYSLEAIPDNKKSNELRIALHNPSSKIREVWKSFANLDNKYGNWSWCEERVTSQKRLFDWNKENKDCSIIFRIEDDEIINPLILNEYKNEGVNQIRRLQRGEALPDGSHLSWASNKFFLDGEIINLPYIDLREILEKHSKDTKINWKVLLYSMSLATENRVSEKRTMNLQHARHLARFTEERDIIKHPINSLDSTRNNRAYQYVKEMVSKEDSMNENWIKNWQYFFSNRSRVNFSLNYKVPVSLSINRGRLMLRVRRNDTWRRIRVPRDLKIWSILINWCLSTPGNVNRMKLESLQYYLFCDSDLKILPDTDINGINFLRGIIESSEERVSIDEKKRLSIIGESGVKYTVIPGKGPHSSRFKVMVETLSSMDVNQELIHRWMYGERNEQYQNITGKELCIIEEPHLRKLVIGDAIGSIVMALLNDKKSRENIDTLDRYLLQFEKGKSEGRGMRNRDAMIDQQQQVDELRREIEYRRNEIEEIENRMLRTDNREMFERLSIELMDGRQRITALQQDFDDRHLI